MIQNSNGLNSQPPELVRAILNHLPIEEATAFVVTSRDARNFYNKNLNELSEIILSNSYDNYMRGISPSVIERIKKEMEEESSPISFRVHKALTQSLSALYRSLEVHFMKRDKTVSCFEETFSIGKQEIEDQIGNEKRGVYEWLYKKYTRLECSSDMDLENWIKDHLNEPRMGRFITRLPPEMLKYIPLTCRFITGEQLVRLVPYLIECESFEKLEVIVQDSRFNHPHNLEFVKDCFQKALSKAASGDPEAVDFLTNSSQKLEWIGEEDYKVAVIHAAESASFECLRMLTNTEGKKAMIHTDVLHHCLSLVDEESCRELLEALLAERGA